VVESRDNKSWDETKEEFPGGKRRRTKQREDHSKNAWKQTSYNAGRNEAMKIAK